MFKSSLCIALSLFLSPLYAYGQPEVTTPDAKAVQSQCEQDILNRCLPDCQKSEYPNCAELCEENARNQCQDAGE